MSGNRIDYLTYAWTDVNAEDEEGIESGNCFIGNGLISEELAIDTFIFTIFSRCRAYLYYAPSDYDFYETSDGKLLMARVSDDDLSKYTYGAPVMYYHKDVLIGKFYVKDVVKKGNRYTFTCVSAIGILAGLKHYGGIYKNVTVGDIVENLFGGIVEYTIAPEAAAIEIYDGFLPVADRRENTQQVFFAYGLSMAKNTDGSPHITFMTASTTAAISDDRLYDDGEIAYDTPASGANVTEHSYNALTTDTAKTLFDNTDGSGEVTDKTVEFDAPCHTLVASGTLTISSSGDNYAVVSGTGTLSGKVYTHQKKVITKSIPGATTKKELDVDEATMVTLANSEYVADRVLAYYSASKTIPVGLIVGTERPGAHISFNDPDDEPVEGFLQSLDINLSPSTLKAAANFVIGYKPTGYGNFYSESILLTGTGTWTAPDKNGDGSPYEIRAVLFQGGQGGLVGNNGVNSALGSGIGGVGGSGGIGGAGGKILNVSLTVTPGHTYSFYCGLGGAPSTAGEETTFDTLTSSDGIASVAGFTDIFTGERFATNGTGGVDGGHGKTYNEAGVTVTHNGITYDPGANGANYGTKIGGGGGGAAVGQNGGVGGGADTLNHGRGGTGANAIIAGENATSYGSGGGGGNGGGGGGFTGATYTIAYGHGGTGGLGGVGGPGAVLIYI